MAGDSLSIVNNWILDYNTYLAWNEFKLDHNLSTSTIDSISGILGKTWEGDESGNDKKLFLTVLARLKDGEDINLRYDEASDMTPLEDLVPHFMNLVNLQIDEKLQQEGKLLLKVIKCEAVQTCCRAGEFEKAKTVFDKLFEQKKKDKVAKTLNSQIRKKSQETDLSYTDFINAMMEYLEQIADSFEEPTIIAAARMFMEKKHCRHEENNDNGNEGMDRVPEREVLEALQENISNSNSVSTDRKKLRRLWDKKVNEMFGIGGSHVKDKPESSKSPFKSPFKEPLPINKTSSKTSKQRKSSGDSGTPAMKPSTSRDSHTKSTGDKSVSPKRSLERASTSKQSSTPKKSRPVSTVSPVNVSLVSDSSDEDSPGFQYRKNKGRNDRHRPIMSSTRCDADNNHDDLDVCSVYSLSSKRKWSESEMLEFYDAVQTCGVGKWAQIKEYLSTSRTNVMLKDKWRNMVKSGDAERIRDSRKRTKVT